MNLPLESVITVNGIRLSEGQTMTVRVALLHFVADLQESGLGDDEVGKGICAGYTARASEIFKLMGIL
jgi:hypothetical protein